MARKEPEREEASAGGRRFTIDVDTRGNGHVVDLTEKLSRQLGRLPAARAGGVVHLFVVGSTAGLTTVEFEPGLVDHDLNAAFEKLAPEDGRYEHEATWNDDNGHAHVRASLVGPDLTVPFAEQGALMTGTWQQVVLIDFDTRARRRTVVCTVV